MNDEWLDSLKPGDEVIVSTGRYGKRLDSVARLTKSQIVTTNRGAFWRKNGKEVGAGTAWNPSYLREPDPATKAQIRKAELAQKLTATNWAVVGIDVLEQVNAVLEAATKES